MDSLTQIALGAAVGEATAGKQVGRKAMLWGAICGTLPDLDVFVPLGDAVKDFTYHRSASHSLFILLAVTPLIVWLILKLHPSTQEHRWRWFSLVYLTFATHVLLDSFTVYGTQIFWPIVSTPVNWSTIFIIDPAYTVPLLIGVILALIASRRGSWGYTANAVGIVISSLYLAWTVGAKLHVDATARASLDSQGLEDTRLLSMAAPFNTVLWRVLAIDEQHYYEGYYSLLDDNQRISFTPYPRSLEVIEPIADYWPVQRLQWFTKGFYSVEVREENILITDLRMGVEPDYVFRFRVGRIGNPHAMPAAVEQIQEERKFERLRWLWQRIWDEEAVEVR